MRSGPGGEELVGQWEENQAPLRSAAWGEYKENPIVKPEPVPAREAARSLRAYFHFNELALTCLPFQVFACAGQGRETLQS